MRNLFECQDSPLAGFGLAVSNDTGDDESRIVESRAVGVRKRIAELASFVNGTRRLRRDMARIPPGKLNCLNSRRIPSSLRETCG